MDTPPGSRHATGSIPPPVVAAPPPTTAELAAGTMVGEYRVLSELGRGGMGRVYAAVHQVIGKRAAVKVLHPALSANRQAIDRFVHEARTVGQIAHPNVVEVLAFGALADGRNYLLTECLTGETLRARLQRADRLSIAEALGILETIALPLAAAHDVGIVHGDLKPDNVFLAEGTGGKPHVKLLDFGTAQLAGTEAAPVGGTPAYMSPEQARGDAVDARTDVYALGVMTYEIVTGQLPFDGNDADQRAQPPASPASLCPAVPAKLDALILAMLAEQPDARPTLEDARTELRACRVAVGDALTPAPGSAAGAARGTQPPGSTAASAPSRAKLPAAPDRPTSGLLVMILLLLAAALISVGLLLGLNQ